MRKVLIIGATSAIGQHVAREYAGCGANLYLLARSQSGLETVASDLRTLGAGRVETQAGELAEVSRQGDLLAWAWEKAGGLDVALLAYGTLPDQAACEKDSAKAVESLHVNFVSAVSWLLRLAERFERQGHGTIAAISSVAGDRGRKSNYVYGSGKGGLTVFLQGLRNRLYRKGVHVLTIQPGLVDTPMTAHFKKNFLFAGPEKVGRDIYRAIERKKDVLYTPWFWKCVMGVLRFIPERIFKRLSL